MQNIRSISEYIWSHVRRHVTGKLIEVVLNFVLACFPGEVCVTLLKTLFGQCSHHWWTGESLCQKYDIGMCFIDRMNQAIPQPHRFRVGVVHSEYVDSLSYPKFRDTFDFGVKSLGIVIEIQWINILIFLGRILGVSDTSVCSGGEPFGVLGHPRVIRCCLQGEIEGNFNSKIVCTLEESMEVFK